MLICVYETIVQAHKRMVLPDPAEKELRHHTNNPALDLQIPWIQRNEFALFFHSRYEGLQSSHAPVLETWFSTALLKLVDVSGGDSHCLNFSVILMWFHWKDKNIEMRLANTFSHTFGFTCKAM